MPKHPQASQCGMPVSMVMFSISRERADFLQEVITS